MPEVRAARETPADGSRRMSQPEEEAQRDYELLLEAQMQGFRPIDPKLYREIERRGLVARLAAMERNA